MATNKPSTVGYFGIAGSNTFGAAEVYFKTKDVSLVPVGTFHDIFKQAKEGTIDFGVVPIENTLAGSIYENYDLLDEYELTIVGEISRRVENCLLVTPEAASQLEKDGLKSLRKVYSHPKALEQCSLFFQDYPWIEKLPYSDTAGAAKYVAEQHDPTIAAIAGSQNATIHKLHIQRPSLENNKYNFTRFMIITGHDTIPMTTANKCTVIATLPHTSGTLSSLLTLLSSLGCNLTKIESRPLRDRPFEYTFYLDFLFEPNSDNPAPIIAALREKVSSLRLLGTYLDERTEQ